MLLPPVFPSVIMKGLLTGASLGFIDTTFTYLTGSAPVTDVFGTFVIPMALLVMAAAGLSAFVREPRQARLADAVLLGLPVLLFGLRGCLFNCELSLLSAGIRWTPTLVLLAASLRAPLLRREHLEIGAFALLALGMQLLAALAFGVRTDQYPALNLRVVVWATLLAGALGLPNLLWRHGKPSTGVVLLHVAALGGAGFAIACTRGSMPPRLHTGMERPGALLAAGSPNVLLIVMDTVRPDHLSVYGYERETSPRLRDMAEHSLVFERATTNATYSLPAHASLLTGLRPSQHGAHLIPHRWALKHPGLNQAAGSFALRRDIPTLAEELHAKGYTSAGISANDVYLAEWTGLQRGFELFAAHARRRYRFAPISAPIIAAAQRMRQEPFNTQDTWPAPDVITAAIEWIAITPRPFFLFLNLFDAHEPYTPPGGSVFRGDRLGSDDLGIPEYDAEIWIVDREIGRLLDYLRSRDLYHEALVIVTADHGQYFGEHGLSGHTHELYEPVLHIPLVAKLPNQKQARRLNERVGLDEVRGLVLDVVNRKPLRPVDVRPKLIAESWAENLEDPADPESILPGAVAVYSDDWKLIHRNSGARDELFNLRSDPDEMQNLMVRPTPDAAAVARTLAQLASEAKYEGRRPGDVPDLNREALERLRALGYIR